MDYDPTQDLDSEDSKSCSIEWSRTSPDNQKDVTAELTDYTFSTVCVSGLWIATASRRGTTETHSVCFEGDYGPGDAAIIGITKLKEHIDSHG